MISIFSSTNCLIRYDIIGSIRCCHPWEQKSLHITALLYNNRSFFGKTDVSVPEVQVLFNFQCGPELKDMTLGVRRFRQINGFSVPSSCVRNQLNLYHYVSLKGLFLSLLFFVLSFFSNSSTLRQSWTDSDHECVSSHSCVLRMVKEWFLMLWCQTRPMTFCWFQVSQEHDHQDTMLRLLIYQSCDRNYQYHPGGYAWLK